MIPMTEPTNGLAPPNEARKFDELVAATVRTAVDEWRIQNDPVDLHGVGMPEYIRRALADAGLLATARLEQLTAEVERLKDVDAEAFSSRFLIQSYDIELGRTRRTLARLLTEAGISPPPEGPWHLAHRVKEEFQAVVRQRDEALAALEKQQALLAEVQASLPSLGACSCRPTLVVVHKPGSYCGDGQFVSLVDAVRVVVERGGDEQDEETVQAVLDALRPPVSATTEVLPEKGTER